MTEYAFRHGFSSQKFDNTPLKLFPHGHIYLKFLDFSPYPPTIYTAHIHLLTTFVINLLLTNITPALPTLLTPYHRPIYPIPYLSQLIDSLEDMMAATFPLSTAHQDPNSAEGTRSLHFLYIISIFLGVQHYL